MKVDFLTQAGKLLKEKKQYRRRAVVFLCLAVVVGYGTVMALKLYGQAMTHKMEVLDCSLEVHEHRSEERRAGKVYVLQYIIECAPGH